MCITTTKLIPKIPQGGAGITILVVWEIELRTLATYMTQDLFLESNSSIDTSDAMEKLLSETGMNFTSNAVCAVEIELQ